MNYVIDIYSDTDNCCYKICRPEAQCDTNVYGCKRDDDCLDGLYCSKDYHCRDINECDVANGLVDGHIYCGNNVDCVNQNKYYDCSCKTGYTNFVEYEGCTDINECNSGSHNCDDKETCMNTIGSFVCICGPGFTGNPAGTCSDLDECRKGTHSCSPKTVLNAETSSLNGWQQHDYDEIQLGQSAYTLEFDVSSSGTCSIAIGTAEEFYEIQITEGAKAIVYRNSNGQQTKLADKSLNSESKLQGVNYIHYYVHFEPNGGSMLITFGATSAIIVVTDSAYSGFSVVMIQFKTLIKETFWRNVQLAVKGGATECVNTLGSYICQPRDSSVSTNFAIGFGGHTRASGSEYPKEFQVITDKVTVCGSHNIPTLNRRVYGGGIAEVNGWLFVCGGKDYASRFPSSACHKYNLNNNEGSWVSAPSMPNFFYVHSMMVKFGKSFYVMGGEYFSEIPANPLAVPPTPPVSISYSLSSNYRFNFNSNTWATRAGLPYALEKAGILADEEDRRIWIFAGHTKNCCDRRHVYYHHVDQNNWHHHSDLPSHARYDLSCAFIYTKDDNKRMICALGHHATSLYWYGLSQDGGWHHMGNLRHSYYQYKMSMIAMGKYNGLLVGGYSQLNAASTRNLWVYDFDNNFHEKYYYLQSAANGGFWTTVKKNENFKSLQNCEAETRTYAAVGWGGHTTDTNDVRSNFHVFLRNRRKGDPGLPSTCHGIIPDLLPAKKFAAMTAVGYKLIVCGGATVENGPENNCSKFETNKPFQEWQQIESMNSPNRNDAVMLSYADAAYVIGGYSKFYKKNMQSVERWTESEGWVLMQKLPDRIGLGCGVTDERYGTLLFGGGKITDSIKNEKFYKYDISKNSWSSMGKPIYKAGNRCGATIIEKRGNGHQILLVVGNNKNQINWLDLTNYHNTGSISWKSSTSAHNSQDTRLLSLSSHEAIEVIISFNYFKTFTITESA